MLTEILVSGLAFVFVLIAYRQLKSAPLKRTFTRKRIVITGASAGIGAALAKQLVLYNCEVCLIARRKEKLEELQEQLQKINPNSITHLIVSDVSQKENCKTTIHKAVELMGKIDVLILNAGIGCLVRLEDVPESDLSISENVMQVNYFANVYLTYFALEELKKNKGMIIVNSSLAGVGWSPDRCFYSASKHALRGFFNSLRCEVGHLVQITTVYPGFVQSEIHDVCYHSDKQEITRNSKFMSAETAANLILTGAALKARDYCLTWMGSFALKTIPFLGPISDAIAIRKANEGIKKQERK